MSTQFRIVEVIDEDNVETIATFTDKESAEDAFPHFIATLGGELQVWDY